MSKENGSGKDYMEYIKNKGEQRSNTKRYEKKIANPPKPPRPSNE